MASFSVESMIRGYHEYKSIWENPSSDNELICEREIGNAHDTHAVSIKKDISGETTTVGHIPRMISSICFIFIRRGSTIHCTINEPRCYSSDLLQGGLEVPCILTFAAKEHKEGDKTKKLLESVLGIKCTCLTSDKEDGESRSQETAEKGNTSSSKLLVSVIENENFLPKFHQSDFVVDLTGSQNEKSPPRKKQKKFNEEAIIMGKELSDLEINFAQELLKH